jgi:transcription elongation factor Elf1
MVRFCPGCQGHLEVLASRNQQEVSHNYWCTVCGRIFEINYLDREFNLAEPWIEAATEARRGENET